MYLVDIGVISEARKGDQGNVGVRVFFSRARQEGAELYLRRQRSTSSGKESSEFAMGAISLRRRGSSNGCCE
jgi:hypothetical protein